MLYDDRVGTVRVIKSKKYILVASRGISNALFLCAPDPNEGDLPVGMEKYFKDFP